MNTVSLNFAGKKTTAYTTTKVPTSVNLKGEVKKAISVKEAKKLIEGKALLCEGQLFKTYIID